jgi:hypothetical protein
VWGGAFGYSARGAVAAQTLAAAVNSSLDFRHLITLARRRARRHPLISHRTFRGKKLSAISTQLSAFSFWGANIDFNNQPSRGL